MSGSRVASMKMCPFGDKVYIKARESEEKTKGGIILPESSREKNTIGTVERVGEDVIKVKVGMLVLWDSMKGRLFYHDDSSTGVIIEEKHILAELKE